MFQTVSGAARMTGNLWRKKKKRKIKRKNSSPRQKGLFGGEPRVCTHKIEQNKNFVQFRVDEKAVWGYNKLIKEI
ncbi:MAG: hypothetical protein IKL99_05540 [Oscillospiraceae bacterium]|nr:hypothetical protein [Oscillospiraceae bacterium]